MVKVFVHGNPETVDVWRPLVAELHDRGVDDVVLVSPPGFGAPASADWDAHPHTYRDWLAAEIEQLDGPVDLVGHDWGAGHTLGVMAARPDLMRSFAVDCGGLIHPDYVWHDAAQGWITPGVGEEMMDGMLGAGPDGLAEAYAGFGLPPESAVPMANAFNADMARCVLALYRGAAQPFLRELGEQLMSMELPPGLMIDATADPYVASELGREVADRLGAQRLELTDLGHWWMAENPGLAADGLIDFWNSL